MAYSHDCLMSYNSGLTVGSVSGWCCLNMMTAGAAGLPSDATKLSSSRSTMDAPWTHDGRNSSPACGRTAGPAPHNLKPPGYGRDQTDQVFGPAIEIKKSTRVLVVWSVGPNWVQEPERRSWVS